MDKTPRTDKNKFTAKIKACKLKTGGSLICDADVVMAHFAEELEAELAEARAEIERLNINTRCYLDLLAAYTEKMNAMQGEIERLLIQCNVTKDIKSQRMHKKPSKRFIYCEQTEGGMEVFCVNGPESLSCLYGWMSNIFCVEADSALVAWMEKAEIGEFFDHRVGVCFRVQDDTDSGT